MPNSATPPPEFKERRQQPLRNAAYVAVANYFSDLNGCPADNLYDMMLGEMEKGLLLAVLEQTGGNQTKASAVLGINRTTLRKKLRKYDLLD